MIKLANILKEALEEANVIQVPEEVLSKLEGIYDYTKKYEEKLKNVAPEDYNDPFIPSTYKKYLKFNDLSGKPIEVSIGYYNNPNDAGAGRMNTQTDTMLINIAAFGDKDDFLDLGEHELVHAMDPKVRDIKIFGKMYPKKGAEPDQNADKYLKSPWEFDAFTAPLVNKLKGNLNRAGRSKTQDLQRLLQMFSDLRTKSVEDVSTDEKYTPLAYFFTKRDWNDDKEWANIFRDFVIELNKVKAWITKPTLYKKFLQRLYTGSNQPSTES
jgi:hypothetical protein